jgi:ribosomal protein S12 methylthiotransferase
MAKVSIVTLGCPKNDVDSESLGGLLEAGGHEIVADPDGSDVVLVNTCGFIDPARRETVSEVLDLAELKEAGGTGGLVLSGCLVARDAEGLADSLPEVDALVDFAAYPAMPDIVDRVAAGDLDQRVHGTPGTRFDPAWWDASMVASPRLRFGRAPWSYVKIAEGCDRGCTFCSIPLMRGKLRSRPGEGIEAEARHLVEQGVTELSLVSQDSVMWGRDTGEGDLPSLLRRLEVIDGLRRLRLMYLHPQGVTDELIDLMCESETIVNYFDLSLQHVVPSVLKAMGRWGGRDRFERMVDRVRSRDPLAGLRATFILGFPGEEDEDAGEVASFVSDSDLDWIGVFTYSAEPGTRSFDMPDHVHEAVARARADSVAAAADEAMSRRATSLVGAELEVLVERLELEDGSWRGRSHREAPEIDGEITLVERGGPGGAAGRAGSVSVGDYVRAEVVSNHGTDLSARALD